MEGLDLIVKTQEDQLNRLVEQAKKTLIQGIDRTGSLSDQKEILDALALELFQNMDTGLNTVVDSYLSDIRRSTGEVMKTSSHIPKDLHPGTKSVVDKIGSKGVKGYSMKEYARTLTNQLEDAVRVDYDQKLQDRTVKSIRWRHLAGMRACDYCKFLDMQGFSFSENQSGQLIHSQCRCGRFPEKWLETDTTAEERKAIDDQIYEARFNQGPASRAMDRRVRRLEEQRDKKWINTLPEPTERIWEEYERNVLDMAKMVITEQGMYDFVDSRYDTNFQKQMAAVRQVKKFKKANPDMDDDGIMDLVSGWFRSV